MSRHVTEELCLLIRSGWKLIAFESFEEERALSVLEHTGKAAGRALVRWSIASGLIPGGNIPGGNGAGSLDLGLKAISAEPNPSIFAILDAHRLLDDPVGVRRLRDLLCMLGERNQVVVLLGPVIELPVELQREAARVQLPLPTAEELQRLFGSVAQGADSQLLDDAVRAALGLTNLEALRVFRKACTRAKGLNDAAVACIVREKRAALRRTPALTFHETEADLAAVGGLGELKHWLRDRRRTFGEEARSFGLPTPRGLLLLGVQGCGKSLCAKAVARQWQFPLLRLDVAAAFGATGSGPEATIREATAVAESIAPVVLWIDEIEKGFSVAGQDSRTSRVFGSFLTWLSEKTKPVFVVATANDVSTLPPELLRRGRFDELFFVDLPNLEERIEILSIHLCKRGRDPVQFDLEDLADQAGRLSGAEIEQVVNAALHKAFAEGRDLDFNDLANAINETVPLYDTYEDRIKELRDWARTRARPATLDAKVVDLFQKS
ncbi:MAG: AAA family ATPase [Myxococcota bacterium]